MSERPTPKPPEELRRQVSAVSEELEESIVPPSQLEEVLGLTVEELKMRFPKRYEAYLQVLQAEKTGQGILPKERKRIERELRVLNSLDEYIARHHSEDPEVETTLREKQVTVFEDLRKFLEQGGTEGYIKLPTGTGKTVLFVEFIEATNFKTLIVVPTRPLIKQTGDKMDEFAEDIDYGKIYSNAKERGRQVTITTYQSLVNGVDKGALEPDDFECLVLDEVHRGLSDKRSNTIRKFKNAIKVGFTATPDFSTTKRVSNLLGTEIHQMSIAEAVDADLLCPFNVIIPQTEVDISDVPIDPNTGRYDEKKLEETLNVDTRNQSALEVYQASFMGEKMVGYCSGVKHAEALAKFFKNAGIAAEVISGDDVDKEQVNKLARLASGETMVIFNAKLLIEGFDDPTVSVVFNLAPTLSLVNAEQRGGRALRKDKNNPNKFATIVDFLDKIDKTKLNIKEGGKRKVPISFAEVAGGAMILPDSGPVTTGGKSSAGDRKRTPKTMGPMTNIKGVKIITKPEEVMRVVKDLNTITPEKLKRIPKDWANQDVMMHFLLLNGVMVDFRQVNKILATYARRFPDECMSFVPPQGGKERMYYSPKLSEIIKTELLDAK